MVFVKVRWNSTQVGWWTHTQFDVIYWHIDVNFSKNMWRENVSKNKVRMMTKYEFMLKKNPPQSKVSFFSSSFFVMCVDILNTFDRVPQSKWKAKKNKRWQKYFKGQWTSPTFQLIGWLSVLRSHPNDYDYNCQIVMLWPVRTCTQCFSAVHIWGHFMVAGMVKCGFLWKGTLGSRWRIIS